MNSREALSKLGDAANENPFVQAIIARNFLLDGDYEQAIAPGQIAFEDNANLRNLMVLLVANDEVGNAQVSIDLLTDFVANNPNDSRARMLLAERKIAQDSSAAIQEYATLIEQNENNFIALNNIATC